MSVIVISYTWKGNGEIKLLVKLNGYLPFKCQLCVFLSPTQIKKKKNKEKNVKWNGKRDQYRKLKPKCEILQLFLL